MIHRVESPESQSLSWPHFGCIPRGSHEALRRQKERALDSFGIDRSQRFDAPQVKDAITGQAQVA